MSIPHHIGREIEEICSNFEDPNDYWYPDEWDAEGGRDRAAAAVVTFLQMYEKGGDLKIRKGKNPEDKGKNPGDKGKQRTKKSKGKSKSVDTDGTPLFSAMVESGTQSQWNMIKTTCQYTGCDWADICFVGEFRLQAIPNETEPGLLTYIDNLLRGMPEALDHMESDFWGNKDLHKKYLAYRTRNPRQVPPPRDTRQSSRHVSLDPDQDRKLYTSVPKRPTKAKGFDKVWVKDWEDGNRRVRGTIVYSWPGWLDIKMPDLPGADAGGRFQAHRHKEFTPDTISKFAEAAPELVLKIGTKGNLPAWKSLEVNHWTFSKPPQSGHFGTAYVVGFNGKKKPDRRVMMAWSRTMCYNKKSSSAVNDEITLYRKDRGLNHPATYYDSDSDAEEESSSEEDESEESGSEESGSEESGSEKDDQGGEENEE
ncbi:hypothetical protein GQ53DRAFT_834948 [Thozetella sp. PMI_491]|nr:hypothetical protein GQ53DRAFT_834948 [Thozetella sp. PMI_491]